MTYVLGKKRFNGKPAAHWEKLAQRHVVEDLVRASLKCDTRSVIGQMAAKQLLTLALGENRVMVAEIIAERDNSLEYLADILAMCLPDPPKKSRRKKK